MKHLVLAALAALGIVFGQQASLAQPPDKSEKGPPMGNQPRPAQIEGNWTVIYMEKDGKKLEVEAKNTVKITGGTIVCTIDGKQETMNLRFGPNNMVFVTWTTLELHAGIPIGEKKLTIVLDADGKEKVQAKVVSPEHAEAAKDTHTGVYIASNDFLSFAFNKAEVKVATQLPALPQTKDKNKEKDVIPTPGPRSTDAEGKSVSGATTPPVIVSPAYSHFVIFLRKIDKGS